MLPLVAANRDRTHLCVRKQSPLFSAVLASKHPHLVCTKSQHRTLSNAATSWTNTTLCRALCYCHVHLGGRLLDMFEISRLQKLLQRAVAKDEDSLERHALRFAKINRRELVAFEFFVISEYSVLVLGNICRHMRARYRKHSIMIGTRTILLMSFFDIAGKSGSARSQID